MKHIVALAHPLADFLLPHRLERAGVLHRLSLVKKLRTAVPGALCANRDATHMVDIQHTCHNERERVLRVTCPPLASYTTSGSEQGLEERLAGGGRTLRLLGAFGLLALLLN